MSRSTSRTNSRSTSTGGNSNSSDLLSMELLSSPRASNDSSIGSATSSADNSNLFWLARQWRSGVQIYDRTYLFQTYRLCFVGSEAVDWLVANVPRLGGSRTEAVKLGQELQAAGYFDHVTKAHRFKDAALYYRFSEDNVPEILNSSYTWNGGATESPLELSARLLNTLLRMYQSQYSMVATKYRAFVCTDRWKAFESATAELQCVNLNAIVTEEDRLCFWLNVYHTLVLHAHASYGFSETANRGLWFWKTVRYNVGGLRYSLLQLEHAVLRASLSNPDIIGASFVLPKFKQSDPRHEFVVGKHEPTIGLVLNCGGAIGCPPIAVYRPNDLHVQLRNTVVAYLQANMSIEGDTVCIPQYLSWYYRDFADSVAEAVKTVADKYLRNPLRDQILSTLLNGGRLRVTDFCWDFSLQFLTQMDDGAIVYNNIVFSEPGSGGGSNSEGSTAMIHVSAKPRFKWRAQRPFTGSLPSARAHHSTAHNEQWIYLYGGRLTDTNAVTGSLYALQLDTVEWVAVESTGPCRYGHSSLFYNGKVLVFGGRTTNDELCNSLIVIDPETGAWSEQETTGDAPSPRAFHASVMLPSQQWIIIGGLTADGACGAAFSLCLQSWTWMCVAPSKPDTAAYHATAALLSPSLVIVIGGLINDNQFRCSSRLLDVSSNAWIGLQTSISSEVRAPRIYGHTTVTSGKLLISIGGMRQRTPDSPVVWNANIYVYNTQDHSWSTASPSGIPPRPSIGASSVIDGDTAMVFGGQFESDASTIMTVNLLQVANYELMQSSSISALPARMSTRSSDQQQQQQQPQLLLGARAARYSRSHLTAEFDMSDIRIGDCIARGGTGSVHLATLRDKTVALKIFSPLFLESFWEEVTLMTTLEHPNILRAIGFNGDDPAYLCLALEYMPLGTVYDLLQTRREIGWELRLAIALGITRGVAYLHARSIVHRDLKSLNVLMASTDASNLDLVKLMDFGDALELDNETSSDPPNLGTPRWAAPETLKQQPFNTKADIYSLGVVLWELCTADTPFTDLAFNYQVEEAVIAGDRPLIPSQSTSEGYAYAHLIEWCWQSDPEKRPTAEQVLAMLEEIQEEYRAANAAK